MRTSSVLSQFATPSQPSEWTIVEELPCGKKQRPFGHIGKVLRTQFAEIVDEPLPTRWIDLINYLNERDSEQREAVQRSADPFSRNESSA